MCPESPLEDQRQGLAVDSLGSIELAFSSFQGWKQGEARKAGLCGGAACSS